MADSDHDCAKSFSLAVLFYVLIPAWPSLVTRLRPIYGCGQLLSLAVWLCVLIRAGPHLPLRLLPPGHGCAQMLSLDSLVWRPDLGLVFTHHLLRFRVYENRKPAFRQRPCLAVSCSSAVGNRAACKACSGLFLCAAAATLTCLLWHSCCVAAATVSFALV
jgi:hypothetical protein